jgi:hypothetical protein
MGTGQTMISILAGLLLAMTILTVNRGFMTTSTVMSSSRYNIMAVSLGTSLIEDATSLAFDEKTAPTGSSTTGAAITDSTQLTAPASLGIDTGELRTNPDGFDDFDDYNCYNNSDANHLPKRDSLAVQGVANTWVRFQTICKVDYVSTGNPSVSSATRTWSKRLRLYIYSNDLGDPVTHKTDTIKLSTVYSYWYFK